MATPEEHRENDREYLEMHIRADYHAMLEARDADNEVLAECFEWTMNESLDKYIDLGRAVTRTQTIVT